jgi:chromosome segregation ATPase
MSSHTHNVFISQEKERLARELEMTKKDLGLFREQNHELQEKSRQLQLEQSEYEHELHTMKDLIATKKSEQDREQRARDKLERELKDTRFLVDKHRKECHEKEEEIARIREDMLKQENAVKEQKIVVDKTIKDQENMTLRNAKLQQDYEEQILNTTHLLSDNQRKANEMKNKEEELVKYKEEVKNIQRARDALARKIKTVEEQKLEVEIDRDALKVHFCRVCDCVSEDKRLTLWNTGLE